MYGRYAPVIRRWETAVGVAPPPVDHYEVSPLRGADWAGHGFEHMDDPEAPELVCERATCSPAFVEWMMGLPHGWVTSPEIGLSRSAQLKALGNGVCPQQAAAALAELLDTAQLGAGVRGVWVAA